MNGFSLEWPFCSVKKARMGQEPTHGESRAKKKTAEIEQECWSHGNKAAHFNVLDFQLYEAINDLQILASLGQVFLLLATLSIKWHIYTFINLKMCKSFINSTCGNLVDKYTQAPTIKGYVAIEIRAHSHILWFNLGWKQEKLCHKSQWYLMGNLRHNLTDRGTLLIQSIRHRFPLQRGV